MLKRTILIIFLCFSISGTAFAGIKLKYGSKSFEDSPSKNITFVDYYGLSFDLAIPFTGIEFLADWQAGVQTKQKEAIRIEETSFGIRKEFFAIVKPFVGLGVSNNKITYNDLFDQKDTQNYNGTWISAGLNLSVIVVQVGVEYRVDVGEKVTFSNAGGRVNLASASNAIYLGFGIGF